MPDDRIVWNQWCALPNEAKEPKEEVFQFTVLDNLGADRRYVGSGRAGLLAFDARSSACTSIVHAVDLLPEEHPTERAKMPSRCTQQPDTFC